MELKSVLYDKRFREREIDEKGKKSESVFGLSTFCRVLKLFPDVLARCIALALKKWPHKQASFVGKVSMKQE